MPKTSRFIYAKGRDEDIDQDVIYIVSRVHWDEEHCLQDRLTNGEMNALKPILATIGLMELMESTYELPPTSTIEDIEIELKDNGVEHDKDFQSFIDELGVEE